MFSFFKLIEHYNINQCNADHNIRQAMAMFPNSLPALKIFILTIDFQH